MQSFPFKNDVKKHRILYINQNPMGNLPIHPTTTTTCTFTLTLTKFFNICPNSLPQQRNKSLASPKRKLLPSDCLFLKPGSYLNANAIQNLTSQSCFAEVEHISTVFNCSLQACDDKIRFAFAGSCAPGFTPYPTSFIGSLP